MRPDASPASVVVERLIEPGTVLTLGTDESHYVARVCRARVGDTVRATDGRGNLGRLLIRDLGREVEVEIVERSSVTRSRVTCVACGAPEGQRADWLIEKLAELGVDRFIPLDFARARWPEAEARAARWRRLAEAALRQSLGAWRMEIEVPTGLAEFSTREWPARRWLADPAGAAHAAAATPVDTIAVIGPAEGLDPAERSSLIALRFDPIALGQRRLRTETAAFAIASLWL